MELTMKERKKVTLKVSLRYQKAPKKEKGKILDEFISLTDYNRAYASFILNNHGRRIRVDDTLRVQLSLNKRFSRKRPFIYGEEVKKALIKIWYIADCICSVRLKAAIPQFIETLQKTGELKLSSGVCAQLKCISRATIDRILAPERKKFILKSRHKTKPGTLLKHQVPIKTFSQWNNATPGFVEIDLVGHDGGNLIGDYIQTLDLTDVATGWTEARAVKNKAQIWVFEALKEIIPLLPFKLLGIDSDNGSEFINAHLLKFSFANQITFTRSHPYRKNDSCFVEQKNYSVVRRTIGHFRYDTDEELDILNKLYGELRLYSNFFLPSQKLLEKIRSGSKIKKIYDEPKTPFNRVIASNFVPKHYKDALLKQYSTLNPAQLKRHISALQDKLFESQKKKPKVAKFNQNLIYNSSEPTSYHFV